MAARIEPYIQDAPPLAWNRDRSIPPASYVVLPTCDRDNEGWAPYSCPHLGCDGFTFDTARDCHDHDDRHHSPPYWCGECDTTFAAQSALERHMSASGHTIWICREGGCDMEGIQFANREAFVGHALESLSHRAVKLPRRAAAAGQKHYQSLAFSDEEEDEAPKSTFTEKFWESCLEPCCHKHRKEFHSLAEWEKHAGSLVHTAAGKLREELRALNLDEDELERRQAAARELRCDVTGCQHHGRVFASSQTFFHHIGTRGHVDPRAPRVKPTSTKTGMIWACVEQECPLVGKEFRHLVNYQRHVGGVEHRRAVRFSEAMRRFGPVPPSPTDSEATEIDANMRTPTKMSFVMMPVTPTSPWMPLSSPVSAVSSGRDEALERRNQELEEMVEELQRRVMELEAARQKQ